MKIEKKAKGWKTVAQYQRIYEFATNFLSDLVHGGVSKMDAIMQRIAESDFFEIADNTEGLKEEIAMLKSNLKVENNGEGYTFEQMTTAINSFEAIKAQCEKFAEELEAKCRREDMTIALVELVGKMQEADGELPDFVNPEKLANYILKAPIE